MHLTYEVLIASGPQQVKASRTVSVSMGINHSWYWKLLCFGLRLSLEVEIVDFFAAPLLGRWSLFDSILFLKNIP